MISKSTSHQSTISLAVSLLQDVRSCHKVSMPAKLALLTSAEDFALYQLEKHAKEVVHTSDVSQYYCFPTSSAFALYLPPLPRPQSSSRVLATIVETCKRLLRIAIVIFSSDPAALYHHLIHSGSAQAGEDRKCLPLMFLPKAALFAVVFLLLCPYVCSPFVLEASCIAPQCQFCKVANTVSPWCIEGYDILDGDPCNHTPRV